MALKERKAIMQDEIKINEIHELISDIQFMNNTYGDKALGSYLNYDEVISHLKLAQQTIIDSARCPRPKELPNNLPWSEKFYNPEEEFDPYVYDGSMTPEDHEKMLATLKPTGIRGLLTITEIVSKKCIEAKMVFR